MAAAFFTGMTVSAGFTAVVFAILLHRITEGNDAQARFTGAFHCGYSSHDFFALVSSELNITYEHTFRHCLFQSSKC